MRRLREALLDAAVMAWEIGGLTWKLTRFLWRLWWRRLNHTPPHG